MIPILFAGNATNFNNNGLGRLSDAIKCTVEEERNGTFELEMTYPITGIHYADIIENNIILARSEDGGTPQAFIIYKISKPLNGVVTINAQHISYLLNGFVTMPFTASSLADALIKINSNAVVTTGFTFYTDIVNSKPFKLDEPKPIRNILGGESGSLLDVYGGNEYQFDNFTVKLLAHRGQDNHVTIRYGKNLTDLKAVTNTTNIYTGIVPFWADSEGNKLYVDNFVVYSEHAQDYPYKYIKVVDFSSEYEEQPTKAQLLARAQSYLANNNGWKIKNNIEVSFVALSQTEEYKNIAPLERVKLCDTVTVQYAKLGVSFQTKVIRTVYNVLLDRYDSLELGDTTFSLAKAIQEVNETPTVEETTSFIQQAVDNATKLIRGGYGGHVVMMADANGKPQEILIMNTDDITTATKVWRWNLGGLGYSSTGYEGTYGTAITMDGAIVADYITTGTLNAALIKAGLLSDGAGKNSWNMQTGDFSLQAGVTVGGQTVNQIASSAAGTAVNSYDTALNQTKVFNKLTNNGAAQGIFLQNGELYINATYINTGTLSADLVRTGYLTDEAGNNYWDLDTGTFSLSASATFGGQTVATIAGEVADDAISDYDETLDQSEVFNRLTNNGAIHGIYMQNNELYINATYIATGTLADSLGKTVFDLSTGALITENFSVTATNFTLDTQGNLTATGATLNNADIVSESGNHEVQIYDGEINFSYNNQYVGSIGSSYGQHGQQGSYGNAIEISGDNITLDAANGGIDAYGYFLAHDDLDVTNTLHVGGDVTFDGYNDISIQGDSIDATCNYDISFHTNNGNFTINGNVPIYDVGASLLITSSVDPDATTADYWYIDNTQVWFNLTLNISPCTT